MDREINKAAKVKKYLISEWYRFLFDLDIFYDFFIGDFIEPWTEGKSALVKNELLKMQASALDRISTAAFTVGAAGVVAPYFKAVMGISDSSDVTVQLFVPEAAVTAAVNWSAVGFFTFTGVVLHLWAELLIIELKEQKK